jgi:hypothetical protein
MPKKPAKNEKEPVMDVTKPGKSEPSANSRPIIVSRKPIIEDPMMRKGVQKEDLVPGPPAVDTKQSRLKNLRHGKAISISPEGEIKDDKPTPETQDAPVAEEDDSKEEKPAATNLPAVKEVIERDESKPKKPELEPMPEAPEETTPKSEKMIQPDADATKSAKTEDAEEESKPDKIDDSKLKQPEPQKDSENDEEGKDSDEEKSGEVEEGRAEVQETNGLVDELAKQAANKKHKEQEDKDEKVKTEQVDKLVSSKKYFLPIGQVTRRRNNRNALIILLLLLILGLVVANFAVDAGLIKTDIKPLTDLIPN